MKTNKETARLNQKEISFEEFRKIVLDDYRIACESREASFIGRREVLTGKAKFGIFGDGKEVAQIAMAKVFREGDFRAGYYRDQTFMMAAGLLSLKEFFAQLYAHTDVAADPSSAGRQMNCHAATRLLHPDGTWKDLTSLKNSSSDISPTGSQMPRLLGLAYASKFYRNNPDLASGEFKKFSRGGNEVAFGTIGDASTSEGMFWEAVNAAAVLQVPMLLSVWDDGYGISVPKQYQTAKESISKILKGFQRETHAEGIEIFHVKGWDYPSLCEIYEKAIAVCREKHVPVVIHVDELTQPQGHSTSGSHERYKSKERLQWEQEHDCIRKMREWMIGSAITTAEEADSIEAGAKKAAQQAKKDAWNDLLNPTRVLLKECVSVCNRIAPMSHQKNEISRIIHELNGLTEPFRADISRAAKQVLRLTRKEKIAETGELKKFLQRFREENDSLYASELYSETSQSALRVPTVAPSFAPDAKMVDGREVLRDNFDAILARYPGVVIFGEDSGRLGGVNQALEGLQKKYGEIRVFDTGIRETTIIGQGIGLALRGLRPIAEIQYLDYLLYALQIMSDDLATIRWRTKAGQKCPLIIRTRGHRLEGIWHAGSHTAGVINLCRGIYVCVPRNMTKAAGFYNTLLRGDDPGLIIEPLNSYRLKEPLPSNIGEFTEPLGIPEILREGKDVTLVTYGPLCRLSLEAAEELEAINISTEIIDVQTLLPFDREQRIVASLKKTNKVLFIDEDGPGGTTAYMMQKVLEDQGGYQYLDSQPRTLTAKEHRPAYGSDGDYFSKPNREDIMDAVYGIMSEHNPSSFPPLT